VEPGPERVPEHRAHLRAEDVRRRAGAVLHASGNNFVKGALASPREPGYHPLTSVRFFTFVRDTDLFSLQTFP